MNRSFVGVRNKGLTVNLGMKLFKLHRDPCINQGDTEISDRLGQGRFQDLRNGGSKSHVKRGESETSSLEGKGNREG